MTGSLYDPQGLNRYAYCRNNPHKYTDPDGRWLTIVIGAASGALIRGYLHYTKTGDFKGAVVQAVIGGVTGAIMGATFGMGAMVMAGKTTATIAATADPMVAATANLGLIRTMALGGISRLVSGTVERSLEQAAYDLNMPGQKEAPSSSRDVLVADFMAGSLSAGMGKTLEYGVEILGYYEPSIDMACQTMKELASKGFANEYYIGFQFTTALITESLEEHMKSDWGVEKERELYR